MVHQWTASSLGVAGIAQPLGALSKSTPFSSAQGAASPCTPFQVCSGTPPLEETPCLPNTRQLAGALLGSAKAPVRGFVILTPSPLPAPPRAPSPWRAHPYRLVGGKEAHLDHQPRRLSPGLKPD